MTCICSRICSMKSVFSCNCTVFSCSCSAFSSSCLWSLATCSLRASCSDASPPPVLAAGEHTLDGIAHVDDHDVDVCTSSLAFAPLAMTDSGAATFGDLCSEMPTADFSAEVLQLPDGRRFIRLGMRPLWPVSAEGLLLEVDVLRGVEALACEGTGVPRPPSLEDLPIGEASERSLKGARKAAATFAKRCSRWIARTRLC
mmetsp:Transcript_96314/g.272324  ORF Transcript_96314/g.272324 Transcript_96314/m.272324 type:complete len:200 (+) Transcript_96314:963-1562(+)